MHHRMVYKKITKKSGDYQTISLAARFPPIVLQSHNFSQLIGRLLFSQLLTLELGETLGRLDGVPLAISRVKVRHES